MLIGLEKIMTNKNKNCVKRKPSDCLFMYAAEVCSTIGTNAKYLRLMVKHGEFPKGHVFERMTKSGHPVWSRKDVADWVKNSGGIEKWREYVHERMLAKNTPSKARGEFWTYADIYNYSGLSLSTIVKLSHQPDFPKRTQSGVRSYYRPDEVRDFFDGVVSKNKPN